MVRNLQLILSNRINHELYSEPTFPAPQLYLLRHTLNTKELINYSLMLITISHKNHNPTGLFYLQLQISTRASINFKTVSVTWQTTQLTHCPLYFLSSQSLQCVSVNCLFPYITWASLFRSFCGGKSRCVIPITMESQCLERKLFLTFSTASRTHPARPEASRSRQTRQVSTRENIFSLSPVLYLQKRPKSGNFHLEIKLPKPTHMMGPQMGYIRP